MFRFDNGNIIIVIVILDSNYYFFCCCKVSCYLFNHPLLLLSICTHIDYLSLNAKTSMFNVIDEPKSSTSIVTTTTTTTPLPLPLLLSSDSAPLLSNSYTASPSNNHITTSPTTTLTYRNISEYLRDFFNKKSNIGSSSSSMNHHYPTLQSSSPLSSKSTLISKNQLCLLSIIIITSPFYLFQLLFINHFILFSFFWLQET